MIEEEKRLLNAARGMDQEALVSIFDEYATALYRYSFRLCRDAMLADQIVGDVFVRLLEQFACGNGPTSNLRSYLFQAAYHLVVDESRRSYRFTSLEELVLVPSDGSSEFKHVEKRIAGEILLQAMQNQLTDLQRHVVILRFMEGLSLYETGRVVGKTVNNVKAIQNRAVKTLRKSLEEGEARNESANLTRITPYVTNRLVSTMPRA
jgi:RNA polymerase sigma-70 factor (ECF subfamily)